MCKGACCEVEVLTKYARQGSQRLREREREREVGRERDRDRDRAR